MIPALWISKTGLDAQQMHVGVISNNLANVSTTGFKKAKPVFADLMYQKVRQPGEKTASNLTLPEGLMLGTGVRVLATQKNFQQGNLQQTNNPLDIAISGPGFLQVERPDGTTAYTRDGALKLDAEGRLVTASGMPLAQEIVIPEEASEVTVSANGLVSATVPGESEATELGQLEIADFINPAGLLALGQNQFHATQASGEPRVALPGENGLGMIMQKSLEASNVNVVEELVSLIEAQRAYEMNSKAINTVDGMLKFASQQF